MEALISSPFTHPPPWSINVSSSIRIHVKKKITANINSLPKHTTPLTCQVIITTQHDQIKKNNYFKKKPVLAIIFNAFDRFISTFLDPSPLRPSLDPEHVLSGHYAPVEELPPTACEVMGGGGPLPRCLDGAYIRNGPNPRLIPNGPYHLYDGDGMLHVLRISHGKPTTFCSRHVYTHKHAVEGEAGYPFVPSPFASCNGGVAASMARLMLILARIVAGKFDPLNQGFGTANTSVALFRGIGIFALCESDLPYRVKVTEEGDIATLGRHYFHESNKPFLNMTAHPKTDQETGEAFAYRYNVSPPYLSFFRIGSDGRKQKDVHIYSIKKCTMIHDFGVTKNFAIFPDSQIVVNPLWVLGGRSPVGIDSSKIQRIGFIPRYATDESEMWWIESPGLNVLHCVNAWEEDGGATIVVVATNASKVEKIFESFHSSELRMEKITINVNAKTVERNLLSTTFLELGAVNPAYAAKKNRYVYAAIIGSKALIGMVKIDLSLANEDGRDCIVASHLYGPGCCGSEPSFVPREPDNPTAEEDDGYLITYLHDENNGESKFLVMDAKSDALDVIFAVKLPRRIPFGFHGLFVSETDLEKV
ncbi:hypothetical protein ABFS83_08G105300 [Erythranthe nasuta]